LLLENPSQLSGDAVLGIFDMGRRELRWLFDGVMLDMMKFLWVSLSGDCE